jgi:hypothetical protein
MQPDWLYNNLDSEYEPYKRSTCAVCSGACDGSGRRMCQCELRQLLLRLLPTDVVVDLVHFGQLRVAERKFRADQRAGIESLSDGAALSGPCVVRHIGRRQHDDLEHAVLRLPIWGGCRRIVHEFVFPVLVRGYNNHFHAVFCGCLPGCLATDAGAVLQQLHADFHLCSCRGVRGSIGHHRCVHVRIQRCREYAGSRHFNLLQPARNVLFSGRQRSVPAQYHIVFVHAPETDAGDDALRAQVHGRPL